MTKRKTVKKKCLNKVMEFYAHVVKKRGERKNKGNNKCSFWDSKSEKRGLAVVGGGGGREGNACRCVTCVLCV